MASSCRFGVSAQLVIFITVSLGDRAVIVVLVVITISRCTSVDLSDELEVIFPADNPTVDVLVCCSGSLWDKLVFDGMLNPSTVVEPSVGALGKFGGFISSMKDFRIHYCSGLSCDRDTTNVHFRWTRMLVRFRE